VLFISLNFGTKTPPEGEKSIRVYSRVHHLSDSSSREKLFCDHSRIDREFSGGLSGRQRCMGFVRFQWERPIFRDLPAEDPQPIKTKFGTIDHYPKIMARVASVILLRTVRLQFFFSVSRSLPLPKSAGRFSILMPDNLKKPTAS
jgi:hypothetical protein